MTTGISAADRAHTIRVAANPGARPDDIVTPGHVFPLRARKGGVLVRTGQTEGSVDLARLADLTPAGVICEIMNEDGTMARMPDLERFAQKHGLRILTIADLIQYRLFTERLVRRVTEAPLMLDQTGTEWRAVVYETGIDDERQFLALVKGDVSAAGARRRSAACTPGPRWPTSSRRRRATAAATCARPSRRSRRRAAARSSTSRRAATCGRELETLRAMKAAPPPPSARAGDPPLREFGLGAQVLVDLGMHGSAC